MTIYTLRNRPMNYKMYGYETSQVYRHKVLDQEGIDNQFLICQSFIHSFWWKRLASMGFNMNKVTVIPHTFSNMSDRCHTMVESDFEQLLTEPFEVVASHVGGKTYKFENYYMDTMTNSDNCVISYSKRSLNLETIERGVVTEGLFYTTDKDGNFSYFNKDGSVALSGSKFDGEFYYQLPDDDIEWYSDEELTQLYLETIVKPGDIFINDSMQDQWLELATWLEARGAQYYNVLHYDHFSAKQRLKKYDTKLPNDKFMVASPHIIHALKLHESTGDQFDPRFVHPVGVTVKTELPLDGLMSNKFMMASNLTKPKRVDMAVGVFVDLVKDGYDVQLDIYGSTLAEFLRTYPEFEGIVDTKPYSEKIVFKGTVDSDRIPRSDYLAYISCSETEMYANAMVECLAEGLIPILSHTPFTHTPVLNDLSLHHLEFDDAEGLNVAVKEVLNLSLSQRLVYSHTILNYAKANFGHEEARKTLLQFLELDVHIS